MGTAVDLGTLMLLALAIPVSVAALLPLFRRRPNARESVTLAGAALLACVVWSLVGPVLDGARPARQLLEIVPGFDLAFAIEPLGMLFALVAGSLWLVNSIYSIGYMRANDEPRQTSFYVCFAVALAATLGIAFAANLVTMFLFYELLTLSTYPLVVHKANREALRAGRLYLIMLLGSSMVLLLPAIVATWYISGTTDFKAGGILPDELGAALVGGLLALYVFGIGKAAVMPMHFWLPSAMVAPTPVSALLHAVAVVKSGVFAILKVIVCVFGIERLAAMGSADWLAWCAGFTVIVASLVALRQDNLKARLAYSTVSQLSYVLLAVAILTPLSATGAALHIAAHAVAKITLFFCAGSIYTATHKTEISELDGIGYRMPWTMAAFAIGALGMIGLPPTAGFLGKWFMLSGAMKSGQWLPVAVIVLSTILNAAYFLPIIARAFFPAPGPRAHALGAAAASDMAPTPRGEAPWPMLLAIGAASLATIMLFFAPAIPLGLGQAMLLR